MTSKLPKLGTLTEVELRTVWDSEPFSFTPWLAKSENLQFLAESLELPGLELVRTEHPVDSFSADIVCKIIYTDKFVLIENQLERTDHLHLGQLLTYAPRFDAHAIIWVARNFTDAHRAALDWLNRITSDNYGFFGVEVKAVKIGDSTPAPLFEVISKPNEWIKPHAPGEEDTSLSAANAENIDFWNGLDVGLEKDGKVQRRYKKQVKGQNLWIPLTGDSTAYIVLFRSLGSKPHVGVYLGIYGDRRDYYWSALKQDQETFDAAFPVETEWQTNGRGTVSKILSDPLYSDPSRDNWLDQQKWLIDRINAYYDVFGSKLMDVALNLETQGS